MSTVAARYVGACAVVAIVFGCHLGGSSGRSASSLPSLKDLKPEANPGPKANLNYGGSVIPVDLVYTLTGGNETIDAMFQGQQFEHEEYASTPDGFALVATSDAKFAPPIPLYAESHASRAWAGTFTSAGIERKATATTVVSTGKLPIGAKSVDAVTATVELSIESGAPEPAKRTLKFTFVKGRGVVQRDFSAGVKRFPVD